MQRKSHKNERHFDKGLRWLGVPVLSVEQKFVCIYTKDGRIERLGPINGRGG